MTRRRSKLTPSLVLPGTVSVPLTLWATASLGLHAACGFRAVGTRERLGRHHGTWRDVTLTERRSPTIT